MSNEWEPVLTVETAPAPAQEVGLTDEEIDAIGDDFEDEQGRIRVDRVFAFARAIIAALRAKESK